MSWTDSTTVKKHLFDLDKLPVDFNDVRAHFNNSGVAALRHKGLVSNSEKVKKLQTLQPTTKTGVVLNGETWTDLACEDLIPYQIVVADDEDLSEVYQLDKDYAVDYSDGKLRRINGGGIGDGATVAVCYQRYTVLTKAVDYTIDYDDGELTVIEGGALEPDTDVWVDYQLSAASGADQLISEAITEAEDRILANLKDEYDESSSDQGIKTGATELVLSIVCRGLATSALSDSMTSAEGRARGWRDLMTTFEISAWRTLRPFLKSPAMIGGSRKSNESWEWS